MLSECRRLWNNFDPMVVQCLVYIGQQTDRPVRLIDNDNMHLYDVQRVQMVASQCLYNNNDRTPGAGARLAYSCRITAANNSARSFNTLTSACPMAHINYAIDADEPSLFLLRISYF